MKSDYLTKFSAVFLIALVIAIPFNISIAFAQSIPNPEEACLEKGKKNDAMAELLQNEVINNLEKTFTILHGINTIWQSQVVVLDVMILAYHVGFLTESLALKLEAYRNLVENPFGGLGTFGMLMNYLLTCQLPAGVPSLCNIKIPIGNTGEVIQAGPFDNMYTAIGCLCLPGVLFNLKKLKTVYDVHTCCIEQACQNGLSTESCDQEFEKGVCMAVGSGAIMSTLVNMAMGLGAGLVYKYLLMEWVQELPPWTGTLISLANAPFKIQSLISAWEKIQQSFDEPTCEDLGFDKLLERDYATGLNNVK